MKKIIALFLALNAFTFIFGLPVRAEDSKISRTLEIYDPSGKLSSFSCVIDGRAYLKIIAGIGTMDVANLWTDLRYFEDVAKVKEINILIMSPGGEGFAGLAMADEISRIIKRGMIVNCYASGLIASAAVPVFASGSHRIAAPGTVFMVHEPSMFKFISQEQRKDLKTQGEMMDMLVDKYVGILARRSKLSKKEWESKGMDTTWFTAQQALEWGLVDKIE